MSYLKYLKAIDVQHAHNLVASFCLCLPGDNIVSDFSTKAGCSLPWLLELAESVGRPYFYASVDSGNQPAEQATVEVFGKGISGIVGLQM